MKKVLAILLIIFLAGMILAGCGAETQTPRPAVAPTVKTAPTATPSPRKELDDLLSKEIEKVADLERYEDVITDPDGYKYKRVVELSNYWVSGQDQAKLDAIWTKIGGPKLSSLWVGVKTKELTNVDISKTALLFGRMNYEAIDGGSLTNFKMYSNRLGMPYIGDASAVSAYEGFSCLIANSNTAYHSHGTFDMSWFVNGQSRVTKLSVWFYFGRNAVFIPKTDFGKNLGLTTEPQKGYGSMTFPSTYDNFRVVTIPIMKEDGSTSGSTSHMPELDWNWN